jgi:hypothetical protein
MAHAGHPTTFLTLTVNPAWFADRDVRARELVIAWRKLRQRILRRFSLKRLPFLAVVERTEKGEAHLHILLRAPYIPQPWLSKQMRELNGAKVVDIRAVKDTGRVAYYISKYLGKAPVKWPGLKRYWRSQDWLPQGFDAYEKGDNPVLQYSIVEAYITDVIGQFSSYPGFAMHQEGDWTILSWGTPTLPP